MKKIMEIRIHGRGGQGSVTAAELIAVAAHYDGKFSQAFPNFGVERRGAPVMAFARISEEEIRLREQIYQPEYMIVQDASLVKPDSNLLVGSDKCHGILINSEKSDWPLFKNENVISVPATKIALDKIGVPFINTPLLGAFAAMTGAIELESLKKAVSEKFEGKGKEIADKNIEALVAAYEYVKKG
jgi:pyruvate ferredoxin oxidoreductase gamma subunit